MSERRYVAADIARQAIAPMASSCGERLYGCSHDTVCRETDKPPTVERRNCKKENMKPGQ